MSDSTNPFAGIKPWEKYKAGPPGPETKPWLKYKASPTAPPASQTPPTPTQIPTKEPTRGESANATLESVNKAIARWRPRWDNPKELQQDPKWYDPGSALQGQIATGGMRAVGHAAVGGVKLLNDLYSAMDPYEYYKRGTAPIQDLNKDAYGLEKGIAYDVPKAAFDILRHFPESITKDPDKFGEDLTNIAMTIDGGIKGTHAITEAVFPSAEGMLNEKLSAVGAKTAKQQAVWAAYQASKAPLKDHIKWRAVADTYVHNNGIGVANDLVKAATEAEKEDKIHTDNLATIDNNIPAGSIKADEVAKDIKDNFADIVKTPDPLNKALNEVVKDANATAPGQWTFVKAMQFRTKIGRAMQSVSGPQYAVFGRAYAKLTDELSKVATKYGLEASWNQHNELAAKMHKSFPLIEKARDLIQNNGEGASMAAALKNDPATKEVVKSLSKYGLDSDKVLDYSKEADKISRERPSQNQRLTSYIYRVGPGTIPAMAGLAVGKAAASAVGAGSEGWIAGLGLGAGAGYATVMLREYLRARRLAPEILDSIIKKREWPGKLKPPKGDFPARAADTSEAAGPSAPSTPTPQLPQAPTPVSGETAKAASLPEPVKTPEVKAIEKSISPKAKARQAAKETKAQAAPSAPSAPAPEKAPTATESKVTKLPPEAASRATKQRERVAKVRSEKGSTALGGGSLQVSGGGVAEEALKKADARANTPNIDVSKIDAVDLEKQLRGLDPKKFKEAIDMRKKHAMTSEEYTEVLRFFFTEAMEDKASASE